MSAKLTATKYFGVKREEGQNPFTGFMSFQHFRGEKLYSDIVVTPEGNRTETERVECYPVSDDAEEKGREQGYYPDTTIVYIRVLWREFEPKRGEYNYDFIDKIIADAKSHGQSLYFRLMAHSTRASDDVPEWLKKLIPCPERPDGERVKDSPTDPLFLELFLEAVRKFGERYDREPTLDAVDISLPGAWGEGHRLEDYPERTLENIVDVYTSVFKHTQLIAQAGRPELIRYGERFTSIGWRGDGLGEPEHTFEKYPEKISKIDDVWQLAPVSFESYWWLGEWDRQGWDIDKIIERTLDWHISSFNGKSMPAPEKWRDKIDYWISRMGYHFSIESFTAPLEVKAGEGMELELVINNIGVAPIYKQLPLRVRLRHDHDEYVITTDVDIRSWYPGRNVNKTVLKLPKTIKPDSYSIEIGITADNVPTVYFATDAKRYGSFYTVGEVTVVK